MGVTAHIFTPEASKRKYAPQKFKTITAWKLHIENLVIIDS